MQEVIRKKRRVTIGFIYAGVFLGIIGLIALWSWPKPTCVDGKKNGNETGVDCGGSCGACVETPPVEDVSVEESGFIHVKGNVYDAYAKISNVNNSFGGETVRYVFKFYGEDGGEIASIEGSTYILPQEKKYIVEQGVTVPDVVARMDVSIAAVEWREFSDFQTMNIHVVNERYDQASAGTEFGEAYGLVRNDTAFDLGEIEVVVLLRDSYGNVLEVNSTAMQTIRAGEARDFRSTWRDPFSGTVKSMEVEAYTNVYSNDNYIKVHLPGGRFQQYQ